MFTTVNPHLVINAPNSDNDTKHADPIANHFHTAAVVFHAASKASVSSLTSSGNSLISAIPPALSEIGPYQSIARLIAKLLNIPKAAIAIQYIPANLNEIKMVTAMAKIGIMQLM